MSTREVVWPDGTPCWVDLVADDLAAAQRFYSELFGWAPEPNTPDGDGYLICRLDGRAAAGIRPRPAGADMPSVWSTYLAASDARATAAKVTAAGGQLMAVPFDVTGVGRMALAFDPTGAAFGLWQAGAQIGAGVVNQPGALTWNECMSRDYERCKAFYRQVFGFEYDEVGDGSTFHYSVIKAGDAPVGGVGELGAAMPGEIPAHWMVYFGADDVDRTVQRATARGAGVRFRPTDTRYGRMAVLQGPEGEVFSVITV